MQSTKLYLQQYVIQIPTYSTTYLVAEFAAERFPRETRTETVNNRQVDVSVGVAVYSGSFMNLSFSPKTLSVCGLRWMVTYLALKALGYVSLFINCPIGCGKFIVGFLTAFTPGCRKETYEMGQDLIEEGLFQFGTGCHDWLIANSLLLFPISLFAGCAIDRFREQHLRVYAPYTEAIKQGGQTTVKKNPSALQNLADAIQEIIAPSLKEAGDQPVDNKNEQLQGAAPSDNENTQPLRKSASFVATVTNYVKGVHGALTNSAVKERRSVSNIPGLVSPQGKNPESPQLSTPQSQPHLPLTPQPVYPSLPSHPNLQSPQNPQDPVIAKPVDLRQPQQT